MEDFALYKKLKAMAASPVPSREKELARDVLEIADTVMEILNIEKDKRPLAVDVLLMHIAFTARFGEEPPCPDPKTKEAIQTMAILFVGECLKRKVEFPSEETFEDVQFSNMN